MWGGPSYCTSYFILIILAFQVVYKKKAKGVQIIEMWQNKNKIMY